MKKKPNIKKGYPMFKPNEQEPMIYYYDRPLGDFDIVKTIHGIEVPYKNNIFQKCKPIIFSTDMVKANNNGTKTQTRRLNNLHEINQAADKWETVAILHNQARFVNRDATMDIELPWQKGDILYVRETWGIHNGNTLYASDVCSPKYDKPDNFSWKPSIYMKAIHARTFLRVEKVRVERLNAITVNDARAEGIERRDNVQFTEYRDYQDGGFPFHHAVSSFQSLWDKINEPRGYGWDKNPWIIVVEFSKLNLQP